MTKKEIRTILAQNLKSLMQAKDMNAKDLQRRSGISDRMIGYILKEERAAGIEVVQAIAKGLNIDASTLLETLDDNDIEHLLLISQLTTDEKEEVKKFTDYVISRRSSR